MKKRFTITLDRELLKKAKIKAVKEDKNFSSLVEELLRRYVGDKKTEE